MERLAPFMSYDEWNQVGPFNRALPKTDEIYDGTTRDPITTPNWAQLRAGRKKELLSNPNQDYGTDDFGAEHGQFFHFMHALNKGDKNAFRLIREAAKRGDETVEEARRIAGNDDAWTCVAPHKGSARVIRAFVDTALEFYPPGKGVLSQQLPKKIEDVDFGAFTKAFAEKAEPNRWRTRVLETPGMRIKDEAEPKFHAPNGELLPADKARERLEANAKKRGYKVREVQPQEFRGVLALFADQGMADTARKWTGRLPRDLAVAPMGGDISADLSAIQRRTQMLGNGNNTDAKTKRKLPISQQIMRSADAVAIFWNGDHRSKGAELIAEAARAGKIAKVLDGEGKEMDLHESAKICMDANGTRREAVQAKSLRAFDLSAAEPHGRFALSLVRDEKLGRISDEDIEKLAERGETINDLADMAAIEQAREEMGTSERKGGWGISSATLNLLADQDIMANARESYMRINKHMNENDVTLIGPEDYPTSLEASGQRPPYLFAQGSVDAFRDASDIVGIVGNRAISGAKGKETEDRIAASRIAPITNAVANSGATVARVEHCTSMPVPVNGRQILILGSGHAHAGSAEQLDDRQAVIDNGGVVISEMPPEEKSSFYHTKRRERVAIESIGNENDYVAASGLLGAVSERLVVTDIDRSKSYTPAHRAIEAALEAEASSNGEKGPRFPAVVNCNDLETLPAFAGNRALLTQPGAAGLTRAGFGNATVEKLAGKVEGKFAGMSIGNDAELGVKNLIRHMGGEEIKLPEQAKTRTRKDAEHAR